MFHARRTFATARRRLGTVAVPTVAGMRRRRVHGAWFGYHVTSRGTLRQAIFLDDYDRTQFLALLSRTWRLDGLVIRSYCLMGNHYHLDVETPRANVSAAMHRVNAGYAHYFNRRHAREGHVFERRYRSTLIATDGQAMATVRYIVRNPVRAGLCTAPEDWAWSSHRATLGLAPPPPFLAVDDALELFGPGDGRVRRYRAYIDAGVDEPADRPPLAELVADGSLRAIAEANQRHRYPLREIAAAVGISPATLSRRLRGL